MMVMADDEVADGILVSLNRKEQRAGARASAQRIVDAGASSSGYGMHQGHQQLVLSPLSTLE